MLRLVLFLSATLGMPTIAFSEFISSSNHSGASDRSGQVLRVSHRGLVYGSESFPNEMSNFHFAMESGEREYDDRIIPAVNVVYEPIIQDPWLGTLWDSDDSIHFGELEQVEMGGRLFWLPPVIPQSIVDQEVKIGNMVKMPKRGF